MQLQICFCATFSNAVKNLRLRNCPPEKILNPRKKFLDPRNTHEKKFGTHEIPTANDFGPTKYPREKIWNTRNTHGKLFWTHETPTKAQWQNDATLT